MKRMPFFRERQPAEASTILAKLGLYGLHEIENGVLAALAAGDPLLLVGSHGSAKTLLARRIAAALKERFWAYDAGKSLFEDLVGFPDPGSLSAGQVRYAATPLSVFDKEFILIDEISRAAPSMQNKWLEVVRSRQVMGMPIPALKHIVAAMNPPTVYSGAVPLDLALAGRFAFILLMPEIRDMEPADLRRIITHRGADDAPLLSGSAEPASPLDLSAFLADVRDRRPAIERDLGARLETYVMNVLTALKASKVDVDGRRAGMIYRNTVSYLAVMEAKGALDDDGADALRKPLWDALRSSMPYAATGEDVSEGVVLSAHGVAIKAMRSKSLQRTADARLRLLAPTDPLKAARIYGEVASQLAGTDHQTFLTRLEDGVKADRSAREMARHFLAVRHVLGLYQSGRVRAPADAMRRAARIYQEAISAEPLLLSPDAEVLSDCTRRPDEAAVARLAARHTFSRDAHGPRSQFFATRGAAPDAKARFTAALTEVREEFERSRDQEEVA